MRIAMILFALGAALAAGDATAQSRTAGAEAVMPSFASDEALLKFLMPDGELLAAGTPPPLPAPPPMPSSDSGANSATAPAVPSGPANSSITNTQIAGVDEGGIVKVSGDHLIVLRRGRLFSISTAHGGLRPVDSIDAFPPGVDPSADWYDEMLVADDLVAVVGYSYRRGGTEINRFRLGPDGRFSFIDAYHLRSNDYYSSSNYASRLIGRTLVIYTPLSFGWDHDRNPLDLLPGLSRWQPDQETARFERLAGPRQIYVPEPILEGGAKLVQAMHTVQRCDLTAPRLTCDATVVLGPESRTFFVSQNAVYVWTIPDWSNLVDWHAEDTDTRLDEADAKPGMLYRIPLDGSAPLAVGVRGSPHDQFSFYPNAAAMRLDVLVTSDTIGDEMWSPAFSSGRPALLRLPMDRFGNGSVEAAASAYQMLPKDGWLFENRFVNGYLLHATSAYEQNTARNSLYVTPVDGGTPTRFDLDARVTRLEALGQDGLAVTTGQDVTLTTVDLSTSEPRLGSRYVAPRAREGESRSQAFFYRSDSENGASGVLGLPILSRTVADGDGAAPRSSASILFLQRADRQLSELGRLEAGGTQTPNDSCVASCTDWYGNARPIFLGRRVFALMGYEVVEGAVEDNDIRDVRRVDFSPGVAAPAEK